MTPSDFIVDVSEADFEYEVITYSQNVPVVVDFWATWCQPCKALGPMLERLAEEAGGAFRLARVDVDANPHLTLRYGVRSIPNIKAFSQGKVVAEFSGLQPEMRVREFLARLGPPGESALAQEKAESLLANHRWSAAEAIFRELDEQTQRQPPALLGLVRSLLGQGESGEALFILNDFPASREFHQAELLRPLAEAMMKYAKDQLPTDTDLDNLFRHAVGLAARGNQLAALDGLLEVLQQNKRYRGDRARQVYLGILELLGAEDADARQYRAELASVLF